VSIEFDGKDEVDEALDFYQEKAPEAFGAAIYERALSVEADSIRNCPVDTGRLRSSAFVSAPIEDGDQVFCVIGHGTDYAVEVHEAPKNYVNGDFKYLRRALDQHKGDLGAQIAKASKVFLEREVGIATLKNTGMREEPADDKTDYQNGPPGDL